MVSVGRAIAVDAAQSRTERLEETFIFAKGGEEGMSGGLEQ